MPRGAFTVEFSTRDVQHAQGVLRQTRRELERELRRTAVGLAREKVLPPVRSAVPKRTGRLARSYRIYRGRRNRLFVRSSLRYAGVIDYGGTVATPIVPRRKKALVVNGHPVAKVTTPRKYPRRLRAQRAVEQAREPFARELERALTATLDRWVKQRI